MGVYRDTQTHSLAQFVMGTSLSGISFDAITEVRNITVRRYFRLL